MSLKIITALAACAISVLAIDHSYGGNTEEVLTGNSYSPAEHSFHYSVHDAKTGDIKSHSETRHGHGVTGQYDLIDSDGHKRIVKYSADKHTGFKATVHREPTNIKIPAPGYYRHGNEGLAAHGHDGGGHLYAASGSAY